MSDPDFRLVVGRLTAERTENPFHGIAKAKFLRHKQGLRYEARVQKQLEGFVGGAITRLEHNPWFAYHDAHGAGHCAPDFIIWIENGVIVAEVKLTWTGVALEKLDGLYMPVVACALGEPVASLVICRNLTVGAPTPAFSVHDAIRTTGKVLQWPDTGRLQWR